MKALAELLLLSNQVQDYQWIQKQLGWMFVISAIIVWAYVSGTLIVWLHMYRLGTKLITLVCGIYLIFGLQFALGLKLTGII